MCSDVLSESFTALRRLRSSRERQPSGAGVGLDPELQAVNPAGAAPQGCCEVQAVATAACPSPAAGWRWGQAAQRA